MAIIFFIALAFQGLAVLTHALYVPMLVHFLYDVAAGFCYSRLGRAAGYPVEGPPAAAAAPTPAVDA
jgi:hypothetical protein